MSTMNGLYESKHIHQSAVDEALEKLGLPNISSFLPGLKVSLTPHQAIGVVWCIHKEMSPLRGGILSDEMGLGKTVQMIGVMLRNRSTNPKCKTTLIIGPKSLLDQWKSEIYNKTSGELSCGIYHGKKKPHTASKLLQYDVVLTTFSTMLSEWRKVPEPRADSQAGIGSESSKMKSKARLLFEAEFYRIILDEAHEIRNRMTRTSNAVTALQSGFRWCLTGTPIINTLDDVYPYLRFLRIKPWDELARFQQLISNNPTTIAIPRLREILRDISLRRTKDCTLDGKPIITLPSKTTSLHKLEFSAEERGIYREIEEQSQLAFNRYREDGVVLKNYSHILAMLLRLRQACSHPYLVQEGGTAFEVEIQNEVTIDEEGCLFEEEECHFDEEECPFDEVFEQSEAELFLDEEDQGSTLESQASCPQATEGEDREIIDLTLDGDDESERLTTMNNPEIIDLTLDSDEEEEIIVKPPEQPEQPKVPNCKKRAIIDLTLDEEDEEDTPQPSKRQRVDVEPCFSGREGRDAVELEHDLRDRITRGKFLPSTKMEWMMGYLRMLLTKHPDEKALVISQWTKCLSLVSGYLTENHIQHVSYVGGMSTDERVDAIQSFTSRKTVKVMLLSLKCGGVGLNLTRANHVISLDLAWSEAVESQAFDRVHRFGQTRCVEVNRLVITDTIEERILDLQKHKQSLADGSYGEGNGKKKTEYTVAELAKLLGLDSNGHPLKGRYRSHMKI